MNKPWLKVVDFEIHKKINSSVIPGSQGGPLMHIIAAKAVCLKEALEPEFKEYQIQVKKNAKKMCEIFMSRDVDIVSNGTENHMFLVDLIKNGITGKDAETALGKSNVNSKKLGSIETTANSDPKFTM